MKKITLFFLSLCCYFLSIGGVINVSTGITTLGAAVAPPNPDGIWKISATNGPTATFTPYVLAAYTPYWQTTPISGTNAGWISQNSNLYSQPPGNYIYDRSFVISSCTASFTTNFSVSYDDSLTSLELVPPSGPAIPLTVVPTTAYHLSNVISYTVRCPAAGTWKIRAKVVYIDAVGSFILSGYVNYADPNCCDRSCKLSLTVPQVNTVPFACGSTINLKCDNKYTFTRILSCQGCFSSAVKGATLKDPSNATPAWASSFLTALGSGSLAIPLGVTPGVYTLTYYYGGGSSANNICDSCKIYLNISCSDCNCTLATIIKGGGKTYTPKCGDTAAFNCGTTVAVARTLNCGTQGNVHLNDVSVKDGLGNTPVWVTPLFLTNLGVGNLVIPTGVSGVFALKFVWGQRCQPCDSCTYYIKVNCCPFIQVSAGPDINICCGPASLNVTAGGGVTPYTYSWTPAANVSNPTIPNPTTNISGTYVVVVTDANGCTGTDTVNVNIQGGTSSCCFAKQQEAKLAKEAAAKATPEKTELKVIPNPFNNSFTIEAINGSTGLDILDAEGKTLQHHSNVSQSTVLGKDLKPGVYMLVLHYKDGSSKTMKVIKN